jgi:Holliday junction resolvase RusA-like endonuclease
VSVLLDSEAMVPPPKVAFTVFGKAEPAGSKRAFVRDGHAQIVDANRNARDWKRQVAWVAADHFHDDLLTGALAVGFTFYAPRPAGHFGTGRNAGKLKASAPPFPIVRPDVLKLARGAEDSLTGVVWRDDAQIVDELLVKRYGSPARCEVRIWLAVAE